MPAGVADLQNLAQNLAAASGSSYKNIARALVIDAGTQVTLLAQAYAPVRTGALRGSITAVYANDGMSVTIAPNVPYAMFMEYGTASRGEFGGAPYTIRPRNGGYLVFKVNGRTIYAKKVVNPGVAPRPFMRPALERMVLPMPTRLQDSAVIFITRGPHAPQSLSDPRGTTTTMPVAATTTMHQMSTGANYEAAKRLAKGLSRGGPVQDLLLTGTFDPTGLAYQGVKHG